MTQDLYEVRARGLIRIGEDGIARENDAAVDAYFAPEFIFHGPGGDMRLTDLKAYFASMRSAFTDFTVSRQAIVVQGDLMGARTTIAGIFTHVFEQSPIGTLAPTGRPMALHLINLFRYDADGRLAEEWAQYDNIAFLQDLGVEMAPVSRQNS